MPSCDRHGAAETITNRLTCSGNDIRVLPVTRPRYTDLILIRGYPVEELAGVVVLGKVGESGERVVWNKVCTVEVTEEVLRDRAAEGRAGVDRDRHGPAGGGLIVGGVFDADFNHVRTLVLEA